MEVFLPHGTVANWMADWPHPILLASELRYFCPFRHSSSHTLASALSIPTLIQSSRLARSRQRNKDI